MNTKRLPALAALALLFQPLPAAAQQHRSYNRRIFPAQAGDLPGTQSTYIPDGSISPSAAVSPHDRSSMIYTQRSFGLPACRSSPYMDGYGDHVRSDLGQRIDGSPLRRSMPQQSAGACGLPRCVSSPYMDGYGDHVRSDLGHRIDGSPLRRPMAHQAGGTVRQAQQLQQQQVYVYGDPLKPAYERGN